MTESLPSPDRVPARSAVEYELIGRYDTERLNKIVTLEGNEFGNPDGVQYKNAIATQVG